MRIGMISLGCPRTLVDSERLLGRLTTSHETVSNPDEADIVIINTCSFVEDSIQESIDTILETIKLKQAGKISKVIVAGCLPQRYPVELYDELKDVDGFMGTDAFIDADRIVAQVLAGERPLAVRKRPRTPPFAVANRVGLTPAHYAYLKASEGCLKGCAFCIIPKLKGPLQSRTMEDVVMEAEQLVAQRGARELIVIGQDTSDYGIDRYGEPRLVALMDRLSAIDGVRWIRLLYCHPWGVTDDLIQLIADRPTICKYLDIAIEHSEDSVLARMHRKMTRSRLEDLLGRLRQQVPGIALRTSTIVGFPGETDAEFNALCDFVRMARFDRLGTFKYSREQGTAAYAMPNQVPEAVKQERYDRLMEIQQGIARDLNAALQGTEILVHIDECDAHDPHVAIGRSAADCPDVDGVVYVKGTNLLPGDFVQVRITDTYEYDLVGETVADVDRPAPRQAV